MKLFLASVRSYHICVCLCAPLHVRSVRRVCIMCHVYRLYVIFPAVMQSNFRGTYFSVTYKASSITAVTAVSSQQANWISSLFFPTNFSFSITPSSHSSSVSIHFSAVHPRLLLPSSTAFRLLDLPCHHPFIHAPPPPTPHPPAYIFLSNSAQLLPCQKLKQSDGFIVDVFSVNTGE